ncbi:MAG: hypothetical protein ABI867_12655 [Kofleriaceae bacterium]
MPAARRLAADLAASFEVPQASLEAFGLSSRTEPGELDHPSTMGARAVTHALAAAKLEVADVDLLIFAGMTRDYPAPWVGAFGVLHELGAKGTAGFDLTNRCASVHDALWLATKMIQAGVHKRVVVCCADRFDYLFDATQPAKTPADLAYSAGAAAAVVDADASTEIAAFASLTNPDLAAHILNAPAFGGSRSQIDKASLAVGRPRRRFTINLAEARAMIEYLRAADAHNLPEVKRLAGFDEIDFVIASPLDVAAQLASLADQGIPAAKTFFLISRLGHIGPADSLLNLGACVASHRALGTRVVLSTRTATYSNAIALRGNVGGIQVEGSGISDAELAGDA